MWRQPRRLQRTGLIWTKSNATGSWCRSFVDPAIARVGDLGPNRNLIARRNLADRLSERDRAARCPTRKRCAGEHYE
jgi:hypothetical protein